VDGLLQRSRAALQALSDGKIRTASGFEAVKELQERLSTLAAELELRDSGIDLREVQESIVEHAAMYANCPEVLGGMLQLVFCLDHVRGWLEQRDLAVRDSLSQLDTLQRNFEDCSSHITDLGIEVRDIAKRASSLELELSARATGDARSSPHLATGSSLKSMLSPHGLSPRSNLIRPSPQKAKIFSVDLQALEADDQNARRLQELERENNELRSRLEEAAAEAAASRSAAEAARNAAEQTAAAAAQVAASQFRPAASPLSLLEQLEPVLAGLPVGVVPGMSELQEDACDAYDRLRLLLIRAAAGVPAEGLAEEPFLPTSQQFMSREPLALESHLLR